jgi:hypothetical protein
VILAARFFWLAADVAFVVVTRWWYQRVRRSGPIAVPRTRSTSALRWFGGLTVFDVAQLAFEIVVRDWVAVGLETVSIACTVGCLELTRRYWVVSD